MLLKCLEIRLNQAGVIQNMLHIFPSNKQSPNLLQVTPIANIYHKYSKIGPKRVALLGIRVSFIPSCFFCRFFPLRSASGSPVGRVLAPSWRHLGPSWDDFLRILVNLLGLLVDLGVHNGWTIGPNKKMDPIVSKFPFPFTRLSNHNFNIKKQIPF